MTEKSCNLCGMQFYGEAEMCETCLLMMSGATPTAPVATVPEPDLAYVFETNQIYHPTPAVPAPSNFQAPPIENFESSFETPQFETFQSSYQTAVFPIEPLPNELAAPNASDFADPVIAPPFEPIQNNFPPPLNFQPPPPVVSAPTNFPAPRANTPPVRPYSRQMVEPESSPSIFYWFTELPTFVKIGLIVLIFSILFAVALKSFMQMDLSIKNDPAAANLEQQKPWFSSWFRSTPNGDEIFANFEKVTYATGKNLTAQSYSITGKAQMLQKSPDGNVDLIGLRKSLESPVEKPKLAPNPVGETSQTSEPEVSYEMFLKAPNKMLMKMSVKAGAANPGFAVFPTIGFDGTRSWAFTKSYVNGNVKTTEELAPQNNFNFHQTNDGISLTFLRAAYPKIEFQGEKNVLNRRAYLVKTTNINGTPLEMYFDIETGLVTKTVYQGSEMYILKYRNFEGVQYPSAVVYKMNNNWLMMTVEDIKSDVPVDDNIFKRESYQ